MVEPMRLRRLRLLDFRNYAAADLELAAGRVVVWGSNAQGKTNLLEAITLVCQGRPLRATADAQLIRWGGEFAAVRAEAVTRERGEVRLEVRIAERKRQVLINGVARRPADLIGLAPVVCFTVDDLEIVKGEPGERRRFLNLEIGSLSRSYYFALRRYQRALEQRNRALKDAREGRGAPGEIEPWDQELAHSGGQIVAKRARFLAELSPLWSECYLQIAGGPQAAGEDSLRLLYQPAPDADGAPIAAQEAQERLREALERAREQDLAAGLTTVGPHRDEVEIIMAGRSLKTFGSQGEQRTAAIALRLAQAGWIAAQREEPPLLLLDDVLSELDERRRAGLLERAAQEEQTIITCSDLTAVPEAVRGEAMLIEVSGGAAAAVGARA
jgi:DNA replication and repair protein RecF